jgi:short subunit fatty acids transporter
MSDLAILALLGSVAFIQNAAFTWVSRSRNSGDVQYHAWASICSNGIWFVTNFLIAGQVFKAIESGSYQFLIVAGLVYVLATTLGSVLMMARLLKTEKGKRQVGAR